MTGPQRTDEERGDLAEAAGFHRAHVVGQHAIRWADVTALYCLPGWEECATASADVLMAEALGVPALALPV